MAAAVVPQAYNNPLRHIGSTRPTRVRSPEEAIGSVRAVRAASSVQSQGGACLQFDPGRGTSAVVRITISVLSPRGRQGRRDRAQYPGRAFQHGVPRALVSVTSLSLSTFSLAPSLSPNPAFDMGAIMNLDDASLVASVVEARGRCPELISFRLNPGLGRTDSETKSNVLGGPDAKFGVPPDQIVGAYVLTTK